MRQVKSTKRRKTSRKTRISWPKSEDAAQSNLAADIIDSWNKAALKERSSWLAKPRLHTAIFEQFLREDLWSEHPEEAFPSPEIKETVFRQRAEIIEKIKEIKKTLGLDDQRLKQLAILAVDFRKAPSIESYLKIRLNFPETDVQVGMAGGIDPLFAIQKKCKQYGIDPGLVAGAMDGHEPAIDELCLLLIDRIVAREKISGPGALQRRRAAISDAMVNYLIAFMVEGADWSDTEIRLPASLILLIRHQLGGLKGDLHVEARSQERKVDLARTVAESTKSGETPSLSLLIKLSGLEPISRATAARWRNEKDFQRQVESFRKLADLRKAERWIK
jgi:hypothetical protein